MKKYSVMIVIILKTLLVINDNKLSWKPHILSLNKKLSSACYVDVFIVLRNACLNYYINKFTILSLNHISVLLFLLGRY